MASEVISLTFASRQSGIVSCKVVNLLFLEGEVRAEYIAGSEYKSHCGLWYYTFLVHDVDLTGGLDFEDIKSCNLLDPYWECNVPATEPLCDYAELLCFEDLPIADSLSEDDSIALVSSNEDCDWDCLYIGQPSLLVEDADSVPGSTPTVTPTPPPTPTPTPTPSPTPTIPEPTPLPTPTPTPPPPTLTPTPPATPSPEPTPSPTPTPPFTPPPPTPLSTPTVPATPDPTPSPTFCPPPPTLPPTPEPTPVFTPPASPSEEADSTPSA